MMATSRLKFAKSGVLYQSTLGSCDLPFAYGIGFSNKRERMSDLGIIER